MDHALDLVGGIHCLLIDLADPVTLRSSVPGDLAELGGRD